jgi:hypothetical protein
MARIAAAQVCCRPGKSCAGQSTPEMLPLVQEAGTEPQLPHRRHRATGAAQWAQLDAALLSQPLQLEREFLMC